MPEQGIDEDDAAYETRKFIVLIDELLDELLYTVPVDENGDAIKMKVDEHGNFILDANGDPIPAEAGEAGEEYHQPILPPSFSIVAAQRIAERAFDHILGFIKPGLTEKEVRTMDCLMLIIILLPFRKAPPDMVFAKRCLAE